MSEYQDEVILDEQEVDVSEEKTPDMSYDEKGAEGDAIKSVEKSADQGKKAPALKGSKENGEKMAKSKTGIVSDMYHHLNDMSKEELEVAYKKLMGVEEAVRRRRAIHP